MDKKRYFIITIDTEGDNQWDLNKPCTTENAKFLPRFQELSEKYGLKPTWLTNYEMSNDPFFVSYMKKCLKNNACEIGMHLHAWNNPPTFELNKINKNREYLYEYEFDEMSKKIAFLTKHLEDIFETKMLSHRSGRWATNCDYFKILKEYGYTSDCSVTPHINWALNLGATGKQGSNYESFPELPYYIVDGILEVPVSIRKLHRITPERLNSPRDVLSEGKRLLLGKYSWIRPDNQIALSEMESVIKQCEVNSDYAMFMLHSSEMMPGGSPNFKNESDIDRLFTCIDNLFSFVSNRGYTGVTLSEYVKEHKYEVI